MLGRYTMKASDLLVINIDGEIFEESMRFTYYFINSEKVYHKLSNGGFMKDFKNERSSYYLYLSN